MNKALLLWAVICLVIGCGGAETKETGGQGGNLSTASTTSTETASGGMGGAGGSTTTSSSTETSCVPGTEACVNTPSYPDPLLAYDPAQNVHAPVWPAGDEHPTGAATGLLGPWDTDTEIAALAFIVEQVPADITVSTLLETACGVPPQDHDPNVGAVTVDGALITSEPFGALGSLKITVPLPATVLVPAGTAVYVSRILTESSAHVDAIDPAGKSALRSYWWGEVDNDCDGKKDATLGWAALAHPTAPGIVKYNYDLGVGVVTTN
jgi:hypothetical protein